MSTAATHPVHPSPAQHPAPPPHTQYIDDLAGALIDFGLMRNHGGEAGQPAEPGELSELTLAELCSTTELWGDAPPPAMTLGATTVQQPLPQAQPAPQRARGQPPLHQHLQQPIIAAASDSDCSSSTYSGNDFRMGDHGAGDRVAAVDSPLAYPKHEADYFSYDSSPPHTPPSAGHGDLPTAQLRWTAHHPELWARVFAGPALPKPAAAAGAAGRSGYPGLTELDLRFKCALDKGIKLAGAGVADSGTFISHKKNHFQLTATVKRPAEHLKSPLHVEMVEGGGKLAAIAKLEFSVHAVRDESPGQTIAINQSALDRSKRPTEPVSFPDCPNRNGAQKATMSRLHFQQTTANNMRKRGQPNPDQRYFRLVTTVHAVVAGGKRIRVKALESDRIIVRASNPGQFESQEAGLWAAGASGKHAAQTMVHTGTVGINTSAPDEALCVHGNIRVTGAVLSPSDRRVKTQIRPVDTAKQLGTLEALGLYSYDFTEGWARHVGREADKAGFGVIAQELGALLPAAVKQTADHTLPDGTVIEALNVVDYDRLHTEALGGVKQLADTCETLEARLFAARGTAASAQSALAAQQQHREHRRQRRRAGAGVLLGVAGVAVGLAWCRR